METKPERFSAATIPPRVRRRVGLVSVRFTMFDPQMPAAFPSRMRAHAARSAAVLSEHFDVIECPLIEAAGDADRVAAMLAEAQPDAVVFAPAMAAPPSLADRALSTTTAPVVIWNAPSPNHLSHDLRVAEATEHTTTVGSIMYANVRSREGRSLVVVTAAHDDPAAVDHLVRTVAAAAEAGALRHATILGLGAPIAGYLDVMATDEELAHLGVTARRADLATWEAAVTAVGDDEVTSFLTRLPALGWHGDPGPAARQSARVAIALERSIDEVGAAAAAVNCHGPFFRENPVVGVTACLGVACQALAGRSIACTGDLPTAIALHVARGLVGAALYCECYAPELDTGLLLVAAGGEGDPAWADGMGLRLEPNDHYPGRLGAGTAVTFALRCGPATLLSLSPASDGWVLAWATGTVEESRFPNLGGANGMFRFDSSPPTEALSRWIASGATHHAALAPSRLDVEVPTLAAALGIRPVRC